MIEARAARAMALARRGEAAGERHRGTRARRRDPEPARGPGAGRRRPRRPRPQAFGTVLDTQFGTERQRPAPTFGGTSLGAPSPYDAMIKRGRREASVPPALVKAVAQAESGFDPNAVSRAGAQGLMQLMPAPRAASASPTRSTRCRT